MQKKLRFFLLALVFVLVLGGAWAGYRKLKDTVDLSQSPVSVTPAESFANCTFLDAEGASVELSSLLGKPVLLNFWATWCPYCVEEFPDLQDVYEVYGDKVCFVMVNYTDGVRETVETANAFLAETGYTFPVYYDTESSALAAYNVYSFPTTILLSPDGTMVERHAGPMTFETVASQIEAVLAADWNG